VTILGEVRTLIGVWCDEQRFAEYPLSREQAITLVSLVIGELHDPAAQLEALRKRIRIWRDSYNEDEATLEDLDKILADE
jgi:hypothetical protein